jgi:hypothetical protein
VVLNYLSTVCCLKKTFVSTVTRVQPKETFVPPGPSYPSSVPSLTSGRLAYAMPPPVPHTPCRLPRRAATTAHPRHPSHAPPPPLPHEAPPPIPQQAPPPPFPTRHRCRPFPTRRGRRPFPTRRCRRRPFATRRRRRRPLPSTRWRYTPSFLCCKKLAPSAPYLLRSTHGFRGRTPLLLGLLISSTSSLRTVTR